MRPTSGPEAPKYPPYDVLTALAIATLAICFIVGYAETRAYPTDSRVPLTVVTIVFAVATISLGIWWRRATRGTDRVTASTVSVRSVRYAASLVAVFLAGAIVNYFVYERTQRFLFQAIVSIVIVAPLSILIARKYDSVIPVAPRASGVNPIVFFLLAIEGITQVAVRQTGGGSEILSSASIAFANASLPGLAVAAYFAWRRNARSTRVAS